MPIIREPDGVEFTVAAVTVTAKDRREISQYIAEYRRTHDQSAAVQEAQEIIARYEDRQSRMTSASGRKTRTASKLKGEDSRSRRSIQPADVSDASDGHQTDRESAMCANRERIAAEALSLSAAERTQLVHPLVDSLVVSDARRSEPAAAMALPHQTPQPVTRRRAAQSRPARPRGTTNKPATADSR